jgi:hypothetical protein
MSFESGPIEASVSPIHSLLSIASAVNNNKHLALIDTRRF